MILQLALGSALICISVIVMVTFIALAISFLTKSAQWFNRGNHTLHLIVSLAVITLWLVLALTISVWIWAILFQMLGIFENMESALYFSVVSFTTLGFGDIVLEEDWRLLSGLIAANGLILFSLSTAFLIETLREILKAQSSASDSD